MTNKLKNGTEQLGKSEYWGGGEGGGMRWHLSVMSGMQSGIRVYTVSSITDLLPGSAPISSTCYYLHFAQYITLIARSIYHWLRGAIALINGAYMVSPQDGGWLVTVSAQNITEASDGLHPCWDTQSSISLVNHGCRSAIPIFSFNISGF